MAASGFSSAPAAAAEKRAAIADLAIALDLAAGNTFLYPEPGDDLALGQIKRALRRAVIALHSELSPNEIAALRRRRAIEAAAAAKRARCHAGCVDCADESAGRP
jgi:predicted ABC-type sugar transport system permease subunit